MWNHIGWFWHTTSITSRLVEAIRSGAEGSQLINKSTHASRRSGMETNGVFFQLVASAMTLVTKCKWLWLTSIDRVSVPCCNEKEIE